MATSEKISTFLKDCIADALAEKIKVKPFEKITVDEITRAAGVGRATYFRHFSSKQEVLTYKIIRHWEMNAEKRDLKERQRFDINNALHFFEINYMLKDFFFVLYAAGLQSALYDAFYKIMVSDRPKNTPERFRETFYSYGLFGLLDEWIRSDYKKSAEEMADIITDIYKTR